MCIPINSKTADGTVSETVRLDAREGVPGAAMWVRDRGVGLA
ncbi:MAG: hypothetical protein QF744_08620 [SAR202 cluster bacterium]|nr:hypothetical protein [SAR202 cluster bacterium]MDP6799875.1 hypothetical protein [SAR202 cluster bacterium]